MRGFVFQPSASSLWRYAYLMNRSLPYWRLSGFYFFYFALLGSTAPFLGFNRAQSSVIEAAILASRLSMLPREKIEREIAYLTIGVEKTGGPREREAWGWLMEMIRAHLAAPERRTSGA